MSHLSRAPSPLFFRVTASLALAAVMLHANVAAATENYPRIGGINIGAKIYDDPGYQEDLAKADWIILDFPRGWQRNGQTMADVLNNIRSINPDIYISQYVTISSVMPAPDGAEADLRQKIESESGPNGKGDWWAYDTNGNKVPWQSNGRMHVNRTSFVTPDSNGDRYPQFKAKRDKAVFYNNPAFNIIYIDNFRDKDWTNAGRPDYNLDGTGDNDDAEYRRAQVDFVEAWRSLMPATPVVANITTWTYPNSDWPNVPPTEYQGRILDGGLLEHMIGATWSVEGSIADGTVNSWGSFEKAMDTYHKAMIYTTGEYVLFNIRAKTTDYRLMRYGLAMCLMDNGYFDLSDDDGIFKSKPWFDEFDVNLGKPKPGSSMTEKRAAGSWGAWKNGVYRRDFENGTVLLNPRGNGSTTVQIEAGFQRINGTQDPTHNNGETANTVTLRDGDGIVLLLDNPPPSPPGVTVE